MRSMIYGAGSLGTILGALLTEGGADVVLVSRNTAHVQALRSQGASITGSIRKTVPVKACFPEEISGSFDVIFLMTKQLENPQIARVLLPRLEADGAICCLQNGIPELSLRGIVPDKQILGGVIPWSATLKEAGVSELTSPADSVRFTIGSPFSDCATALESARMILSMAGKTEVDEDLLSMRWSKLLVNASVSALSSSLGLPCGGVTHDPALQELCLRAFKECVDVGRAQGVTFRPVNDYPVAEALYFRNEEELHQAQKRLPDAFDSIRSSVSSILQDLRRGRRTEVHAISGVVCRAGRECGIPTPVNDRVVSVIERIERGTLSCSPDNVREYEEFLTLPTSGRNPF